jgi:DNA-binding transcriptional LysR family regulator
VRLAAPHALICHFLADPLAEFQKTYPRIRITLCADMPFDDFLHGHADVALRISLPVPNELGIRRLCDYRFGLYAREDLSLRLREGTPLAEMPYVLLTDASRDLPERKWMVDLTDGRAPTAEASSTMALRATVATGMGVGALACYLGDAMTGVARIEIGPEGPREGLYLITHPTQRSLSSCRAVSEFLIGLASRRRAGRLLRLEVSARIPHPPRPTPRSKVEASAQPQGRSSMSDFAERRRSSKSASPPERGQG